MLASIFAVAVVVTVVVLAFVTDLLAAREQFQGRRLRDFRPRGAHERNRRRQRP